VHTASGCTVAQASGAIPCRNRRAHEPIRLPLAPMSFVTQLEGAIDGTALPARTLQTTHAGRPLWVRYDLAAIRRAVDRDQVSARGPGLSRWRELLPLEDWKHFVTLGEGLTPLLDCPRLAAQLGVRSLSIKDESALPTGSFKARGLCLAISMASELGVEGVAIPTAGNAGGAMAAYAARAGMEAFVFMPEDTPAVNQFEAALYGARAFRVNGLIHECAAIVREGAERAGWFDMSTLKEPYRIEGKKTMGLELAQQLGWRLPDVILYPTGGGTGLIGMWKAFGELRELGWLAKDALPRMFSCQSDGCAPIAEAFDRGERFASPPADPRTIASGIRVPKALGDFMILDAVRASEGRAMAASESGIAKWMRMCTELEGIALCPESAICIGVLERALAEGFVERDESIALFNTGAAQKYVEVIRTELPRLDKQAIDWDAIGVSAKNRSDGRPPP
jgi:threonine synthase